MREILTEIGVFIKAKSTGNHMLLTGLEADRPGKKRTITPAVMLHVVFHTKTPTNIAAIFQRRTVTRRDAVPLSVTTDDMRLAFQKVKRAPKPQMV